MELQTHHRHLPWSGLELEHPIASRCSCKALGHRENLLCEPQQQEPDGVEHRAILRPNRNRDQRIAKLARVHQRNIVEYPSALVNGSSA